MELSNYYNIASFSASFLISVTCLIFKFSQQRTERKHNKIYIAIVGILIINSITSILAEFFVAAAPYSKLFAVLLEISQTSYFLFHSALCPLFFFYVTRVSGSGFITKRTKLFFMLPFLLTLIPIILNPFFHSFFYYTDGYKFTRGPAEASIYISGALYLALSALLLMFSWQALTSKRKIALVYFFMITVIGILTQLFFMFIKAELFAESLALLGVLFAIESEDDRIDVDTGLYNRKALKNDINSFIFNKRQLYIVCVRITNSDILRKAVGSENTDILSEVVSEYLKTIVPKHHIYNTNPGSFVLTLMDCTKEHARDVCLQMKDRFDRVWTYGDSELPLSAIFMAAEVPERITSAADAFYMVDSPIPANNDKKILLGSDLDYLLRRSAVENAVTKGLKNNSFEVYYQPTYQLKGQKLHGAEALIRLHDKQIGSIFPDEFIPIAEQIGMIEQIDDFVLREVCKFIKSGLPEKFGMDSINVNLSVIECMQPGFVKHINNIVDEIGVDKHMINFEITESVAASDYKLLNSVVNALKNHGFRFSMDDYGTGYSNMESIFSLDFDVVKIDKSILWSAETSELGQIILENSVRMIKQMKREILVEGVETCKQIEMLDKLAVDYLQGYFFSKPIPKEEFIKMLQDNDEEKENVKNESADSASR